MTSRLTPLATLRELHAALPGYDWRRLEQLVAEKRPDLLCLQIDRRVWEADVLEQTPIEVREALASLSRSSEITLIPIGAGGRDWAESGVAAPRLGILPSLRRLLFRLFDRCTVGLMKLAGDPPTVNSPLVEHFCGTLCDAQVWLADRQARRAWLAKNEELLEGILRTVRRDPGRRILVALDCRRKHWLSRRLGSVAGVTLVDFGRF